MKDKYLPSKQFITKIIKIIILVIVVFSIYQVMSFVKNRPNQSSSIKLNIIKEVQDDSNNNGIPDWEERLWGLNPYKNGKKNKEIILAKRQAINPNANFSKDKQAITKNENLSREFFAAIMSLQQTGKLNEKSMGIIADSISQKIVAKPIPDIYTMKSLTIIDSSIKNNNKYYSGFIDLVYKYKNENIGDELTFIIQGLAYKNPHILSLAGTIATAYRNFGQDLIKIPVPRNLALIQLKMANDYEKNAQSIDGLMQIPTDPLVGMRALINYKKYNDALTSDINKLSSILKL